jgi:cytidine deaminase
MINKLLLHPDIKTQKLIDFLTSKQIELTNEKSKDSISIDKVNNKFILSLNGINQIEIDNLDDLNLLYENIQHLRAKDLAFKTRENAYTPFSKFKVGAALISKKSQNIYSGCNVENSSYGATICAERSAILAAVASEGEDFEIDQLIVVASPMSVPCALCLQVIAEFGLPNTAIYLYDLDNKSKRYLFKELLPEPFIFKIEEP